MFEDTKNNTFCIINNHEKDMHSWKITTKMIVNDKNALLFYLPSL